MSPPNMTDSTIVRNYVLLTANLFIYVHNSHCECMYICISMIPVYELCACLQLFVYPEGSDLLLSLSTGLFQLSLSLLQLALQGKTCSLQAANLGLSFLQGKGQLRHLSLDFQLLFFMFQAHLQDKSMVNSYHFVYFSLFLVH